MATVLVDPILGRLVWSDCGEWYEGEAEITPGHPALLFICSGQGEMGGSTAVAPATRTIARLRHHEGALRQRAAEALTNRYPDRFASFGAQRVAEALWAGCVYFWEDGGARVDWDDDAWLLNGESSNWVSYVDPHGQCTTVAWEHEKHADQGAAEGPRD
jgi:hypothetical protein